MHLKTSRSGLACAQFDSIERASKGSVERVLAAFNLGVAAATAGALSRAEAAFTRALGILSEAGASRDIAKVLVAGLSGCTLLLYRAEMRICLPDAL